MRIRGVTPPLHVSGHPTARCLAAGSTPRPQGRAYPVRCLLALARSTLTLACWALLTLVGCAFGELPALTNAGALVRSTNLASVLNCLDLGEVEGNAGDPDDARLRAQNEAGELRAMHLVFEGEPERRSTRIALMRYRVTAHAYDCPASR